MKISVVMIDGNFRENLFGADYFTRQDFPEDQYEVLWVDYYEKANPLLASTRSCAASPWAERGSTTLPTASIVVSAKLRARSSSSPTRISWCGRIF